MVTDATIRDLARSRLGFERLRAGQLRAVAATAGGRDVLAVLPTGGGKPVLDAGNYIPQRDGRIPGPYDGPPSSEVLQQHLNSSHVVKVFNNITFWHLLSLPPP